MSESTQLTEEAQAASQAILALFDQITITEASTITEIGWSVAATLAHLGSSYAPALLRTVIERSRQGKSLNIPAWIIHLSNWVSSIQNKRKPLLQSRAQFERDLSSALAQIADLSDADLGRRITVPLQGETTLEEYLRYTFVGHLEEHGGQIRRALAQLATAH